MHTVTFIGNLGKDPEERVTSGGKKLITFSIAVQVNKENTVWYDVNIWEDKIPQFSSMLSYLKKGSKIVVMGDLGVPEVYQTKSGETRVKNKIQPFSLKFAGSAEKKEEKQSTFEIDNSMLNPPF